MGQTEADMSTFLVTGACGFIGSHLVEALLASGHTVRALDDLSSGHRSNIPSSVSLTVDTIEDADVVNAAMEGVDGCFHLAAIASVDRSRTEWAATHSVNLSGTINIFDAARKGPRGPVPVVYASSAAAYGDNDQMPLRETARPLPISAYGADKLGCEQHARVAGIVHGVPTMGCRFFNVFGPRQDPHSPYSGVISIFANRLIAGQPLTIFGDGEQSRDFIYVADVVAHLLAGMEHASQSAPVINVCTGRSTTVNDLLSGMADILGAQPEVSHGAARPGDIRVSLGDPGVAVSLLGVKAGVSLKEGLSETLAWMKNR